MIEYSFCPNCKYKLVSTELGYQACSSETCSFVFYNNPTPVVGAIVEYGQNKLLLGHNKAWPPKWYGLITGFLEKNEHPNDCIIREIKEEIGLEGEVVSFVGHYMFHKMNQLIIIFHVKCTGNLLLDEEIDDVKIIPFDKVRTWPTGTGEGLRDFLISKGYNPEEMNFANQG